MKTANKKIKGATSVEYNDFKFKSKLEFSCYRKLESSGLDFSYESEKIILWTGFKPEKITVYAPSKIKGSLGKYEKDMKIQTRTLLNITYTPDFIVRKGKYVIYFDVKGKENDIYPLKKKMFLKTLENRNDNDMKYMFFEPHSVKQMLQAIEIIKKL